jgi:hypothetical protein
VKDETLPLRSLVLPSQTLIKIWRVENTGAIPWPKGTKLYFLKGDRSLASEASFDVPEAKSGETVDVTAVIATPSLGQRNSNGRHTACFRLADDAGNSFGPRLWCDIVVADTSSVLCEAAAAAAQAAASAPASAPAASPAPASVPAEPVAPAPAVPASAPAPAVPVSAPAPPAPAALPQQGALPAAVPQPSAPSAASSEKYALQLQILATMGFQNQDLNLFLLESNNGNLQKVCEFLLNTLR